MNSPQQPASIGFLAFLAMAITWVALAYFVGQKIASLPFGFVVVTVLIFAVPVALSGAYSSAVNQTRDLAYYKTSGWVHKLFSGRVTRSILWVVWALATSFFMLVQFSTYSALEWVALAIVIPVYWCVYLASLRLLSSELRKRYVITAFSIVLARWWCLVIMFLIYLVLNFAFSNIQNYATLSEALAAKRTGVPEIGGSAVVQVFLRLMTFSDGIKAYVSGDLKQFGEYLPLLLKTLGGCVVFFNASATFACFVIPAHEFRRVFGPISDDDPPMPISRSRIALASALISFVTLFVYVPFFAHVEKWAGDHPRAIAAIMKIEREAERVDGVLYNPGTIQKIEVARAVLLGKLDVSRATLEGQVDRAFDRIEQNVDRYLDWYYSLSAEYKRLAKLLMGEIEDYMEKKLYEQLEQGEAFKFVSDAIAAALASNKSLMDENTQTVKAILDASRLVLSPAAEARVVKDTSLDKILSIPAHLDVVTFESRATGGAIATGVGVAIAAKVASKGIFKTAAKALSKVALSKAATLIGGPAAGMVIGSFVPVVGTVVGGFIGGAIAGIAVDKTLLKLEEAISRDDFKKQMLLAIREARVEFKARLFATP